jgi:GDP-4-dehydro-6-deoxy-D-mannose reductase
MRILVTGITGFAGTHLAEALLAERSVEVFGAARQARWPPGTEQLASRIRLITCDLTDAAAVGALLGIAQPERVFHLAGYPHTGRSVREVEAAWAGNLTATRNLYEAFVRWGGKPRILYVGSGLIYGDPECADQAFNERALLQPTTPYGASKAAADLMSFQYTRTAGLEIVRGRPFNHIGPRQSSEFAVAHFARQIAAIEQGRQPPLLETGNLSPRRDLTDVRDVARAYLLLMDKGRSGEAYNIGSGTTWSMQEIIERLLALSGARVDVRQREDLVRSKESAHTHADTAKLRQTTGWTPLFTLEQSLAHTLDYWRSVLNADPLRPATKSDRGSSS